MQTWWDDLGDAQLDEDTIALLEEGMAKITAHSNSETLRHRRDTLIVDFLQSIKNLSDD